MALIRGPRRAGLEPTELGFRAWRGSSYLPLYRNLYEPLLQVLRLPFPVLVRSRQGTVSDPQAQISQYEPLTKGARALGPKEKVCHPSG